MSANISILGNAGRDVSLRHSEKGTAVASFPIASNSFKNGAEGRVQVTHWFNVIAFGKTAEMLAEYVKKGTYILVHGRLSFSPWLTNDGDPRSGAEVALFSFEFVGRTDTNGQQSNETIPETSEPDIPGYTGPQSDDPETKEPFVNQF